MDTCLFCDYYNSCTGKCEVTGRKEDSDDRCKYAEPVNYDDWEY